VVSRNWSVKQIPEVTVIVRSGYGAGAGAGSAYCYVRFMNCDYSLGIIFIVCLFQLDLVFSYLFQLVDGKKHNM